MSSPYSISGKLTLEEAAQYNKKIWQARSPGFLHGVSMGCIGSLACEYCGTIVSGTCLCMGIFTCPECNKENGKIIRETQPILPLVWEQESKIKRDNYISDMDLQLQEQAEIIKNQEDKIEELEDKIVHYKERRWEY